VTTTAEGGVWVSPPQRAVWVPAAWLMPIGTASAPSFARSISGMTRHPACPPAAWWSRSRTMAGLKVARAEGRTGGRRRKMTPKDITTVRRHMTEGKLKAREVAKMYGVSERSLWRNLRWAAELAEVRSG
jgi:hypothetical protein